MIKTLQSVLFYAATMRFPGGKNDGTPRFCDLFQERVVNQLEGRDLVTGRNKIQTTTMRSIRHRPPGWFR